jgi:peptidoglycan/LPS O-acetylase OafA/YrhL
MTAPDGRSADVASHGFRADLEGLRACAVVLVLLYHASVPGFGGGYVGVDVFFVLSGFLITGLLLREVTRSGTISLPSFYARRARRLLPASALVLLVTVVASVVLLPRLQVPDVSGDAAAAALYVSNLRFAAQATDYLQADLAPSPLLHFWSLGVEEQFYLFWPAIVLLVTRGRGDAARRIGIAAAVIGIASFGLSLWLTEANAPWAFFSLPTRAWELGLGALLAIGATRLARLPTGLAAVAAWVGLAMVGASGVVLDTATPFPGTAALLPTLGSALVIAGGFRQTALAPGRWLSMAAPRFLGRISYSLYLWHWPVLVLPAAALDARLPWWARGALVLVAIGLAAATQHWVEDPLRHGRWIGTLPRRNLALAGALSLVVATVSFGIGTTTTAALQGTATPDATADEQALADILGGLATPSPTASPDPSAGPTPEASPPVTLPATEDRPVPAGLRPSLANARADHATPYDDGCHVEQPALHSATCAYGDLGSERTMVLFGDSHAVSWFPALERIALEDGWRLVVLTKSACSSVDIVQYNTNLKRVYHECVSWREEAFARIADEQPDIVVVANSRGFRAVDDAGTTLTGADRATAWRAGMARTLDRLETAAATVVVLADTPLSEVDPPECLSKHPDSMLACATPHEAAVSSSWLEAERTAAAAGGATFIDPTAWVCPSDPCPPVLGNFLVYRDPSHLSTAFAAALAPLLRAALASP